jgi:hypothetical protein
MSEGVGRVLGIIAAIHFAIVTAREVGPRWRHGRLAFAPHGPKISPWRATCNQTVI